MLLIFYLENVHLCGHNAPTAAAGHIMFTNNKKQNVVEEVLWVGTDVCRWVHHQCKREFLNKCLTMRMFRI